MLNLQTSGIYHTDFPQYVRILTEDSFLESVTWRYMHWFYGQLDTVFVNSEEYRGSWIKRGFDPEKLKIFPRGLDTQLFHPTRRDSGGPKELVENNRNGLITKSHNVEDLTRAIRELVADPERRKRMGDLARESVIDRTWPTAFRKFWAATEV